MSEVDRGVWRAVMAATAVAVLVFYLFALREALNPFILYLALVALLLPFREWPGHTTVVTVATLLVLFWVLHTTGFLLAPFVLAIVLAYVLDPLVDVLEGKGLARSVAILLLALPVLLGLAAGVVFGLPALGQQVTELIERVPVLLGRFADWLEGLDRRADAFSLPPVARQVVERIREVDPEAIVNLLETRQAEIARRVWGGVLGLGRGLASVLSVVGYVVLTPVLAFYLLRDWDELTTTVEELVPPGRRERIVGFAREYDDLLGRYLRGQLLVAVTVGSITALGLWLLSFPFAFLLGVLVGLFGLVPYLGLVLSLIPAVAIALMSGQVLVALLKVGVVYGTAQALEAAVISPRIVGESVGLHPVWVVLALTVGGFYFGFVGLLIGVPVAVGIKLLVREGMERYRESGVYLEGDGAPEAD